MSSLWFDLRASVRHLRQRKLPAFLAAATLGIGLGISSALFAILHALYVRPLPLDPGREVFVIRATNAAKELDDEPLSRADMNDLLATRTVAAFGGMRDWSFPLLRNGIREPVEGALASPGLFAAFRTAPHLGRLFREDDDRPDRNRVALLSFASWQRRFGNDPAIVGRTLTLGGDAFTVIGVLPPTFLAPSFRDVEIWAPLSYDSDYQRGRDFRNLRAYARLASGASPDSLRAELLLGTRSLERQHPETNRGWSARAVPLLRYELHAVTRTLAVLTMAVALLLAMACANMSGLLFAETMTRTTELGLRAAAGGSPPRLFRQLFLDHLLLCLSGGAAAAGVAYALLAFSAPFAAEMLPRFEEVHADRAVLAFAIGGAVLLAAILAAASVLWVTRAEPAEHIRAGGRALTGRASRHLAAWMAGAQAAFAFVLLCLAMVYGRSYRAAATADPGFDRAGLLLIRVQAVERMRRPLLLQAANDATTALAALPGTRGTAIASSGPMFGGREETEVITDAMQEPLVARYAGIDPRFFSCLRTPLAAGRPFAASDDGAAAPVVIVSRAFAARLFPGGDAIGKQVRVGRSRHAATIVGVAGDADDPRAASGGGVEIYFPFAQSPRAMFFLVVRGTDAAGAAAAIRKTLPSFMIVSTATMEELVDRHLLAPRLQMFILIVFALGATLLTAVAIYDMVAFVTGSRAAEVGLRLALGASPRRAGWLLVRSIAVPVAVAIPAGIAAFVTAFPREQTAVPIAAAAGAVSILTALVAARAVRRLVCREPVESLRSA